MDIIPHHIFSSRLGNVVNLRQLLFDLRAKNDPAIKVSKPPKIMSQFSEYYLYRMTSFIN